MARTWRRPDGRSLRQHVGPRAPEPGLRRRAAQPSRRGSARRSRRARRRPRAARLRLRIPTPPSLNVTRYRISTIPRLLSSSSGPERAETLDDAALTTKTAGSLAPKCPASSGDLGLRSSASRPCLPSVQHPQRWRHRVPHRLGCLRSPSSIHTAQFALCSLDTIAGLGKQDGLAIGTLAPGVAAERLAPARNGDLGTAAVRGCRAVLLDRFKNDRAFTRLRSELSGRITAEK